MVRIKTILLIIFAIFGGVTAVISPYTLAGVKQSDINDNKIDVTLPEYEDTITITPVTDPVDPTPVEPTDPEEPVEYEYSITYHLGGYGINENPSYPNDLYKIGDKLYYAQYFNTDSNGHSIQVSAPDKTSSIHLFKLTEDTPEISYTIYRKAKGTSNTERVKTGYVSIDLNSLTFKTENCVGNSLGGGFSWSYTSSTSVFETEIEYNGVKLSINRSIQIIENAEVNEIVIPD